MIIKKSIGRRCFEVINVVFMLCMMVVTVYPFYYCITCSLSDSTQLIGARGLMLLPKGFSWAAYRAVIANPNIFSGYRNTILLVVAGTCLNLLFTSIAAFLLTRRGFALRKPLALFMIFTMYFSGGMIPGYLLVNNYLNLGDSLWALILPGLISTYNMLIMRTNFEGIPSAITEAATIDGANDILVLFRIILPLSIPTIAVMALFYGVGHWNSWFSAMLYIETRDKYPLQLILREILLLNSMESMMGEASASDKFVLGESIKYATILVATVPILFVYPFIQKYFVKGIMIGAVK